METSLEEAIREYWGERCPDFEPGCPCCRAWAEFDQLNEKAGDWQTMRDERDMAFGNYDGIRADLECCEYETQKQASFIHDQNKYIDWLKADRAKLRGFAEAVVRYAGTAGDDYLAEKARFALEVCT